MRHNEWTADPEISFLPPGLHPQFPRENADARGQNWEGWAWKAFSCSLRVWIPGGWLAVPLWPSGYFWKTPLVLKGTSLSRIILPKILTRNLSLTWGQGGRTRSESEGTQTFLPARCTLRGVLLGIPATFWGQVLLILPDTSMEEHSPVSLSAWPVHSKRRHHVFLVQSTFPSKSINLSCLAEGNIGRARTRTITEMLASPQEAKSLTDSRKPPTPGLEGLAQVDCRMLLFSL